jgi:hypothetical protein
MPKVADLPERLRVWQFLGEHGPPHFHVRQGGRDTLISIADPRVIRGVLSSTSLRMVTDWARPHQGDLALSWLLSREGLDIRDIPCP